MKPFNVTTIILTFIMLLSLTLNRVMAQNATFDALLTSNKSIVREFKENVFIVYNYDGNSTVNYVDLNSATIWTASTPVVDINDFEINDGNVYFCGSFGSSPLVGVFNVDSLFFMGSAIRYSIISSALPCNEHPGCSENILSFRNIEVLPIQGDKPHFLLVGESTCSYISGQVNRCIAELYSDLNGWNVAMSQEHSAIFYYDDIEDTQNKIVIVGHKHQSSAEYIVEFYKPGSGQNMFEVSGFSPTIPYYDMSVFYNGGGLQYYPATDEEYLIEHITGDIFATVCHGFYRDGVNLHEGTVLNLYNTANNVVSRTMIPPYGSKYGGLRYNRITKNLYLVNGNGGTGTLSPKSYIEFMLNNTYTNVTGVRQHEDISSTPTFMSIDACPQTIAQSQGQAIITGISGGVLHLWRHLPSPITGCSETKGLSFTQLTPYSGVFTLRMFYSTDGISFQRYYPTVLEDNLTIRCKK